MSNISNEKIKISMLIQKKKVNTKTMIKYLMNVKNKRSSLLCTFTYDFLSDELFLMFNLKRHTYQSKDQ